ncbi:MAG: ribosome biogenesis GTPase Der [Chloroflexi bacterium]|nr:ribosome biogenesis GTPase Der [Chloroflexota bacterium]
MSKPLVAIVGRPNVGKSTLFNRLIGHRLAIVSDWAGTTRDRLYADMEFGDREFTLVDTGGIMFGDTRDLPGTPNEILASVRAQAEAAIDAADAIIFLVDVEQGIHPHDLEIAQILRRAAKPIFLSINKCDNDARRLDAAEFYQLGLGDLFPLSAYHGIGVGDLLDAVLARLPRAIADDARAVPRIAIVGRPNVGKSSLLNAILGEERAIVSEIPGTTRDALDTEFQWGDQPLVLIDTAGLRKRGHIESGIEKYSVLRALRAIQRAEVALLVIDATQGVEAQDQHVASYILDAGKAVVIVVNKWDLLAKDNSTMETYTAHVRAALDFIAYAPIIFVSAKTGQRVRNAIDQALAARAAWHMQVPAAELNELARDALARHAPPTRGKRTLKMYDVKQLPNPPPAFLFTVSDKKLIHFTYERFLQNEIRARWAFEGAPIRMIFKNRGKK